MAKNIWLYSRKILSNFERNKIKNICKEISPDNIVPKEPVVKVDNNFACGIMNYSETILVNNNSMLLGKMVNENDDWHIPKQDFPDGSFALFRDGIEYCELVSDIVASRTIWYFKNDDIFIASTSQRAIIMFIGEFQFDERIIPWMLSSGSLGPEYSWDKRIRCVPPNSSVLLNKKDWSINLTSKPVEFKEDKSSSDEDHEQKLRNVLNVNFESIKLNYTDWVLPLSGGYDSRGILCLLNSNYSIKGLRTVTWGLKSSLDDKKNDAFVAEKLAEKMNTSHDFFHTDLSKEPIEKIINRFILNGEGRIDHLAGYIDGFKIWKILHEQGVQGVIRGDESFGLSKVLTSLGARQASGLGLCSDFSNLKDYEKYGFSTQKLPDFLERTNEQSLEEWRDRLYQGYRLPTIMAALSDLKLSYVELINPLLSNSIISQVRKLPDHLRRKKNLFRKIVDSISPEVEYATKGANASPSDILRLKNVVELLTIELSSEMANELFPKDFLNTVLQNLKVSNQEKLKKEVSSSYKSLIKRIIPLYIRRIMKSKIPSAVFVDYNVLAFRIFIIIKMNNILKREIN